MHPVPKADVPETLRDLGALIQLAYGTANRAHGELRGDARELASRMVQHLRYLRGVSELLTHEATREEPPTPEVRLRPA